MHPASLPLIALMATAATAALPSPAGLRVVSYAEQALELQWDSVPGAAGYNLYTSPLPSAARQNRILVNSRLITSGTRFTYIWNFVDGKRVRAVKGVEHHLAVTAVDSAGNEGPFSAEVDNCYFEGYRNVDTPERAARILVDRQTQPLLPVKARVNRRKDFARFMAGPGKRLHALVKQSFDPRQVGACSPVTTILVRLLGESGMFAYKAEGTFIKEYHAFAVINIEGVEYVLDLTADQFVPGVSPVFFPRDLANLSPQGRLARSGMPIYQVARLYAPDQVNLSLGKTSDIYWDIYNRISVKKDMRRDASVVEPAVQRPDSGSNQLQ